MIEGTNIHGIKIKPKLRNVLSWFHLAIEFSMTPGNNIFDKFDTNELIQGIYENIPLSFKKHNKAIKQRGEFGNPLEFYLSLISYLGVRNSVNIQETRFFSIGDIPDFKSIEETIYERINTYNHPEIIVVSIMDSISKDYKFDAKELILRVGPSSNIKYRLDSAVVRDTKTMHFCALLDIGGNECGFDGVSFRKLSDFKWKSYLGKDQNFTFEGSKWAGKKNNILWNFRQGYYMLFYYRV